jgi:hypothetical protein
MVPVPGLFCSVSLTDSLPDYESDSKRSRPARVGKPGARSSTSRDRRSAADALARCTARAHQNAANATNATSAQQQTAPPPGSEGAASKNGDADRKPANGDRAAMTDDQDRGKTRYGRHGRRHWRGDGDGSAASSSRRQDARGYDRLYDSYSNRRDRSFGSDGNNREQSFGDARGDQDDAASRSDLSRSEMRRFGRDARHQRRWHDNDRNQALEPSQPRAGLFWGGGFFPPRLWLSGRRLKAASTPNARRYLLLFP